MKVLLIIYVYNYDIPIYLIHSFKIIADKVVENEQIIKIKMILIFIN